MKDTTLQAKIRTGKGSSAAGRLRRAGQVPAVIYGEGRAGTDVQVNFHEFVMMLRRHSENVILDLAVEGDAQPTKVMVKAMQLHPLSGRVIHVDFYEVSMNRPIVVEVPLNLVGTPEGVATQGGMLEHTMRVLNVECLPGDVPAELDVDVSALLVGDAIRVKDVVVDAAKLTVLDDEDLMVASIAAPRTEEMEEAASEADEAAPAEGEAAAGEPAEEGGAGAEE